mmetsp:Transcript_9838/g.17379  ORF Transcript_9838/g.17379 Transcript_9838/m.17379 type:complete len:81 (+) Transcript_9838:817-1059(+)
MNLREFMRSLIHKAPPKHKPSQQQELAHPHRCPSHIGFHYLHTALNVSIAWLVRPGVSLAFNAYPVQARTKTYTSQYTGS